MKTAAFMLLCLLTLAAYGQNNTASVSGTIIDENEEPISGASVIILGRQNGILSSDSGKFQIIVPSGKAFALVFTHTGFRETQQNFFLSEGEKEEVTIKLFRTDKTLETVFIKDDKERTQTGLVKINPKSTIAVPSATGGVEGLIKILVGSNNELTSQYSVRGGNYDENLIYINDFEIYRPYLVRSGQQEGLSFINPALARNINFYNGGFQAKYGDKISSVLDIQYKKPTSFGGSVYVSLLEQGFHLEGAGKNQRLNWIIGVRNKTNRSLLSSQEVSGRYVPSSADLQAALSYKISDKNSIDLLGILSGSKFTFIPSFAQKSTAVFSPLFTADIGLDIYFQGQEKDSYGTALAGITFNQSPNEKLKLRWLASFFKDEEKENFDIIGYYLFGERNFDKASSDFGKITNPLGAGIFQNYARNNLAIDNYNVSHKGSFDLYNHFFQWGTGVDRTIIHDKLNEWEYQDSAGYSLPYSPDVVRLSKVLKSTADITANKYSGYLQDNITFGNSAHDIAVQAGVRFNYNSLNQELLVSPRMQFSIKPAWKRDIVFKAAAGMYSQPPFYREMRRYDGTINTALNSQKSLQFVAGFDYSVSSGNKPVRITTEAYYKRLTDVVSYDIDNVRIRYSGENDAKAYAAGIETRVFTELVKDAESWLSLGISRTKEDLSNDHYYIYKNAAGEIINATSDDQKVTDSTRQDIGYLRRPIDRLITVGLFLQDYLSTNKNFRVHVNMLYGSNMTYNIPNSVKYRNGLIIEPYMRVDIGFSALLLSEKSTRRSHSPFRQFENIWASLEVFNLIDRDNTISYQLIKDFANNVFSIPNRLTPRLVNFKLLARF